MASATYESVRAIRAVRAAIAAERRGSSPRWSGHRPAAAGGHSAGAERRGGRPLLRGLAASVLIASGYVALMAGARWVLGLLLG